MPRNSHPNGFLPIKAMRPGDAAWNLSTCICGGPKDFRAALCKACFLTSHRNGDTKGCSGCQRDLPISEFYLRSNGERISRCKACINNQRDKRHAAYAIRSRARRLKRDLPFRIGFALSNTIRDAVKKAGSRKSARAEALLGCSVADFMQHIERRWLPGMAWVNWGRPPDGWQLDHIRPVASFDLTDPAQQRACFHYTNYQPLWAIDNIRKGAKWSEAA